MKYEDVNYKVLRGARRDGNDLVAKLGAKHLFSSLRRMHFVHGA